MLVVILVILPAAKENAGPLQSERSKDGLAGFALFFFNLIVGVGPVAVSDRMGGKFNKALADKGGRGPPPGDQSFCLAAVFVLTAADGDWS